MADAICMHVGDRRPVLRAVLGFKDEPVPQTPPLTNAVGVSLRMVERNTGAVKIDGAAGTIESVSASTVSYEWAAGDTDTPGDYEAWFIVDYGGGIVQTFPACDGFRISIE